MLAVTFWKLQEFVGKFVAIFDLFIKTFKAFKWFFKSMSIQSILDLELCDQNLFNYLKTMADLSVIGFDVDVLSPMFY